MGWKRAFWCSLLTLAAAAHADAADEYVIYSGVANARHSDDFLYGERHALFFRNGRVAERVVLYTCRDGSAFARKTVSYTNPLVPDFLFENANDGMREGIREASGDVPNPAARTVFYRDRTDAVEKSGPVPDVSGLVADAGFDEFVQSHWDSLVSGKTLEMRFLLPSRLVDYGFQVQRVGGENIHGTPTEVFRLRLSGIWGWLLPGIDVYYSTADRVLVRYDGLSDLQDASGHNFKATIGFPVEDRKVATAEAMLEARQARIAPCHNSTVAFSRS